MKKLFASAAVLIALVSCGSALAAGGSGSAGEVDPSIVDGTAAKQLKRARGKWQDRGAANYRITVHRSCFCAGPFKVTITVKHGKAVRISARPWYGPRTVPGMFRIVGRAIKGRASDLEVKYHARLGFPERAWIDYIAMAADDEMGYRITGFKQL